MNFIGACNGFTWRGGPQHPPTGPEQERFLMGRNIFKGHGSCIMQQQQAQIE
jgi:hypothetical protein